MRQRPLIWLFLTRKLCEIWAENGERRKRKLDDLKKKIGPGLSWTHVTSDPEMVTSILAQSPRLKRSFRPIMGPSVGAWVSQCLRRIMGPRLWPDIQHSHGATRGRSPITSPSTIRVTPRQPRGGVLRALLSAYVLRDLGGPGVRRDASDASPRDSGRERVARGGGHATLGVLCAHSRSANTRSLTRF